MRILIFNFILLISFNGIAGKGAEIRMMDYIVQSDTANQLINDGFYKIRGKVQMFSSLSPLSNVLCGSTKAGIWTKTDSLGNFELNLDTSAQVIYFYLDGWSEVVIEDYYFGNKHDVNIDVYMNQVSNPEMIMKRKPVIYLYSEIDQKVDLKIDPLGEFTFTYPEYDNGWSIEIKNNKVLVDDKSYPYLFWEANSPDLNYSFENAAIEGSLVETAQLTSFFEKSLTELGLNQVEMTDFITYWVPALSSKTHCFIQFVIDDDYESKIAHLIMKPKPTSSRRVFIIASELDGDDLGLDILPQSFESFDRHGLTIVEWGGATIDLNNLGH